MKKARYLLAMLFIAQTIFVTHGSPAYAATGAEIDQDATIALERLYKADPGAKAIGEKATAILVFPSIVKAGLIVGGAYGEGALRKGSKTIGYYSSVAASYGLQAGAQSFGYVMFFMNEEAVSHLESSQGWEIGAGPSVAVLDKGFGKKMSTTTLTEDVYAVIFDQSGLMAGLGLEGSKISKIEP
jgi:lipid-binding SYLF domain-containing protein